MRNVTKSFDDFMKFYRNPLKENLKVEVDEKETDVEDEEDEEEEDWNWDQWMNYIKELEEEEKIVSVLKAKLGDVVRREDYEDAAKLKVGIAAAAANDTVGRVISQLNKAVEEERFEDAAFIRDNTGAGLIGWWAGTSDGSDDPYGRIIRINAEYGRYVARSYSPRQLATATPGAPLFEVFLSNNDNGVYRQLVYSKILAQTLVCLV
ncbi:Executer 1 protein [Thalictrum thalictroides]|uniref:Executer 1 protein n=1 Tax=Thalictrum thalictroides TaxID=46969 RepID=A0A7J6VAW3_THATH|nr:Executer 1 protein [Thalictrum thalictroides]